MMWYEKNPWSRSLLGEWHIATVAAVRPPPASGAPHSDSRWESLQLLFEGESEPTAVSPWEVERVPDAAQTQR